MADVLGCVQHLLYPRVLRRHFLLLGSLLLLLQGTVNHSVFEIRSIMLLVILNDFSFQRYAR